MKDKVRYNLVAIKQLLKPYGTQQHIADMLGEDYSYLKNMLNGFRRLQPRTVDKIVALLNKPYVLNGIEIYKSWKITKEDLILK